jgi:DNA-binding SARP family transcriptional activator
MLAIRLLGASNVRLDGRLLVLKRRKSRALLYYLAASPAPVTRRHILALLWADHTAETARHNLRSTLYSLRRELGDHLLAEDDTLALAGDIEVDARQFALVLGRELPDDAALSAALALYQGDFLADFDLPDTPDYDDWITVEREHYRRLAINGYATLSRRHEARGDYAPALAALARALDIDPFQEDLQRAGLRLHYLAGDRAGAIRRYEELVRLLDAEMGVPPMAETRALYDAILTDRVAAPNAPAPSAPPSAPPPIPMAVAPPSPPTPAQPPVSSGTGPATPPFVGRAAELQQLHTLRPRGQLILVEGEPGIGKTQLVRTFLEQARGEDPPALVLVGRARELESRLPYQPLIEALRSLTALPDWPAYQVQLRVPALWWAEAARLVPEFAAYQPGSQAPRNPDESRLWEGVYQIVSALARSRPVLLFVDDLHWADPATLGLVGYTVRQAANAGLPLTVIAASRPVPPRSEVAVLMQSLLREGRLAHLKLDVLRADEVLDLAQAVSPTAGYPLGSWLYRSSEGNPFVLVELLRYARDRRILMPDGLVNLSLLPASTVVPPTVYTLIQARLATVSDAARRVLDAAVAVGREFDFEVVARAAALSDNAALDALDELRQARLIRAQDGTRLAFDHTLTLEVALQEVGELRHRLLHRRVAAALETIHHDRLDAVAGLLVHHYNEGDQPVQAAKYAWLAGQRAMRLAAWKAAAEFFQQALVGADPDQRRAVLTALGTAQLHAGELAAATQTLQAALDLSLQKQDPVTLGKAFQGLGEALLLQARYAEAVALAARLAEGPLPAIRCAAELLWGTALSMEGLDLDGAARHLQQAEAQLKAHPGAAGAAQLAQAEFELGNLEAQQGRLAAAIARYRETQRLTDDSDNDEALRLHVLAHNNLAYHLLLLGDPSAKDYAHRGAEIAQDKGMLTLLPYLLSTLGELALAEDNLAAAEDYFSQGLAQAQRLAQPERIAGLTANLGLVAQRRGQTAAAIEYFTAARDAADAASTRFLAAQIRLWLAPLLTADAARAELAAARAIITAGHYHRLDEELTRLEQALAAV